MNFLHTIEHHILDHKHADLFAIGPIQFSFTKHVMMMWIASVLLITVFALIARGWPVVPRGFRNLVEVFIVFIRDEILLPNTGKDGLRYLPYFLTLFFFILTCNLIGLLPAIGAFHPASATGNISVTAGLALLSFGLINYAGIRKFGVVKHIKNFAPHGLPVWLVPLMLPLEFLGLFAKAFALSIRLFANMVAGHIILLAFLSLAFLLGSIYVSFGSIPVALGLYMLEVFVAFLQAYIFTFLTSIFVGAAIHPH